MLDTLLDKKKLKALFSSINNPMQALQIKNNIEACLDSLNTPSDDLLALLKQEGFSLADFNASVANEAKSKGNTKARAVKKSPRTPKAPRKVNVENRTFLIENDMPVKVLTGRAISAEAGKGAIVQKFVDMTAEQQSQARKLV